MLLVFHQGENSLPHVEVAFDKTIFLAVLIWQTRRVFFYIDSFRNSLRTKENLGSYFRVPEHRLLAIYTLFVFSKHQSLPCKKAQKVKPFATTQA